MTSDFDPLAEILNAGSVELVIHNDGPGVQLDLPPNTRRQDLSVSFTGGPLIVGAQPTGVQFQTVPEPRTLIGILVALVCFAARAVHRRMSY